MEVLLNSLRIFLGRFCDTYVFVDALDESPRDHKREGVLRVIQAIRKWCLPGVHLLVTSRDQLDIRESLHPSCDQDISMKNVEIDRDIVEFISYDLNSDPKLQRWKTCRSEIQTKLTQGAQGVFRYVECQLSALRRARNRNQLDECLRSLPRDLDKTYERILCSIDETYIEDVRRILTVLYFSIRPLTINELIDAYAVDLSESPHLDREGRSYEKDDLIDICLGLVEIAVTKDNNGHTTSIARIAHFSVQKYLQSRRILQQKAAVFKLNISLAHKEIAELSLVYLLEPMLSDGELNEEKLEEFTFAHYAAKHWYQHYANSQDGRSALEWLVLKLLTGQSAAEFERAADNIPSPLYYASLLGVSGILMELLDRGLNVNVRGGEYGNAVSAASSRGHEMVVRILLGRGADVNIQGGLSGNALKAASSEGHEKVLQMLLECGADVNSRSGIHRDTPLQAASLRGHGKVVQMLTTAALRECMPALQYILDIIATCGGSSFDDLVRAIDFIRDVESPPPCPGYVLAEDPQVLELLLLESEISRSLIGMVNQC